LTGGASAKLSPKSAFASTVFSRVVHQQRPSNASVGEHIQLAQPLLQYGGRAQLDIDIVLPSRAKLHSQRCDINGQLHMQVVAQRHFYAANELVLCSPCRPNWADVGKQHA